MTRARRLRRNVEQSIRDTIAAVTDPILFLWCAYIILTPLYIFPSGLPQPGDVIIVLLAPLVLLRYGGRLFPGAVGPLRRLMVFTLFVFIENLAWSLIVNDWSFNLKFGLWMSPLFYVYNMLVFWIALALYGRYRMTMLRLTYRSLYAATVGLVLFSPLFMRSQLRQQLLFNSPNQLGYHAVLAGTIFLVAQRPLAISTLETSSGLIACAYLALLSSSKAALAGLAMLMAVGMISRAKTIVVTALIAAGLLAYSASFTSAVDKAQYRIANDRSLGFFEERGYDRIANNPEYVIMGSGEGAYDRFHDTTKIGSHELHSSFGTLVFCYGIMGVILFVWFAWSVLRKSTIKLWLVVAPAFSFGFTHQALRTTLFWVLLAMVLANQSLEAAVRRKPTRQVEPQAHAA